MKINRKIPGYICLLLLLSAASGLYAQQVRVNAEVNRKEIKIGEQLRLKLSAEYDEKITLSWPAIRDKAGEKFDVVSISKPVTSTAANKTTFVQEYVLTSFDSGRQHIPAFVFSYSDGNDTVRLLTDSIPVNVSSVQVDTTQTFYDITGPEDAPFTFREILPYVVLIAVAVVLGLAVFFLVRYLRSRRRSKIPEVIVPEAPVIPPHITAYEKLAQLENEKLWQQGMIKEYYIELTGIVRQYIQGRFGIDASEMTTDEIMDGIRSANIQPEATRRLGQMLRLADLVKFAKARPGQDDHELAMTDAREFVDLTKAEASPASTDIKP